MANPATTLTAERTRALHKKCFEQMARAHYNSRVLGWDVDGNTVIDQALRRAVVGAVEEVNPKQFEASSPWQAAAFLYDRQARSGFVDIAYQYGEQHDVDQWKLIFRGQNARHRGCPPNAWRQNEIDQNRLSNWVGAFVFLLRSMVEPQCPFGSLQGQLYYAAAQHYWVPTELLDWTIDPAVGVSFAYPKDQSVVEDGDRGVVLFTDLERETQSQIILPPPFVSRIYKQRGLFHYTEDRDGNQALFDNASKITFPLTTPYELPQSYRQDATALHPRERRIRLADLQVPEPMFTELHEVSKGIAEDLTLPDDYFAWMTDLTLDDATLTAHVQTASLRFAGQIHDLSNKYAFSRDSWEALRLEWLERIESYIGWLAMFNTPSGNSLTALQTIERMIEANRDALYLYSYTFTEMPDAPRYLGDRLQFVQQVRRAIEGRYGAQLAGRERGYYAYEPHVLRRFNRRLQQ